MIRIKNTDGKYLRIGPNYSILWGPVGHIWPTLNHLNKTLQRMGKEVVLKDLKGTEIIVYADDKVPLHVPTEDYGHEFFV